MAVNRDNSYTNLSGNGQTSSAWLEKQQSGSRKSKFLVRSPPLCSLRCEAGGLPGGLGLFFAKASVAFRIMHWADVLIHPVSRRSSVPSLVFWRSLPSVSALVSRFPTRTGNRTGAQTTTAPRGTTMVPTTPATLCIRTIQTTQATSQRTLSSNSPSMGWLILPTAPCTLTAMPHWRTSSTMFRLCPSLLR